MRGRFELYVLWGGPEGEDLCGFTNQEVSEWFDGGVGLSRDFMVLHILLAGKAAPTFHPRQQPDFHMNSVAWSARAARH